MTGGWNVPPWPLHKITVVGLGKLGAPLAAVLASAGHEVVGVDLSEQTVNAINNRMAPLQESGLQELIGSLPIGQLTASTRFESVSTSQFTFVLVPSPSDPTGRFSSDYVLDAVEEFAPYIQGDWHTVVICSTLMPGQTAGRVKATLEACSGRTVGENLGLAYSPEFIALGSVIRDMRHPDTVIIGAQDERSAREVQNVIRSYIRTMANVHILSFTEAELAKIAVNAYVTTKISFANTIGEMCEHMGVAAGAVCAAVGDDSRIVNKYLRPGGAYAGPCFPRDSRAFQRAAEDAGTSAPISQAADEVNNRQVARAARALRGHDSVAVLGIAYKADTPVIEASFGLSVAHELALDGTRVCVHDPIARVKSNGVEFCLDAELAISKATAVFIALPLQEYAELELGDRLVVDPWGLVA